MVVLDKRLSLSSKPLDSIIFLAIWFILLPQRLILHDLFTMGFNGKTLGIKKLLATAVVSNERGYGSLVHRKGLNITWSPESDTSHINFDSS